MIFRNLTAWDSSLCRGDQVKLPGPAWLWPDVYDFKGYGFEAEVNKIEAKEIYTFITKSGDKEEAPLAFGSMLKSVTELRWKKGGEEDEFDMNW